MLTAAGAPRVSRAALSAVENSLDGRVKQLWTDVRFLVIGPTRGVYLEGYGAVFTIEVDLVNTPTSLMHPTPTAAEVSGARQKKLERIPMLKKALREALVSAAASLEGVPASEQVTIVAFLPHYPWEDSTGVPVQVTAQASKGRLLDAQRAGTNLDSIIQVTDN
ncbi:MAG TPA: hypothetical protein VKS01_09970 [Bryobacteraceae bacterium]|nr:hypothetical protein [Bryobacteraceae bacterium]